LIIFKY